MAAVTSFDAEKCCHLVISQLAILLRVNTIVPNSSRGLPNNNKNKMGRDIWNQLLMKMQEVLTQTSFLIIYRQKRATDYHSECNYRYTA